MIDTEDIQRPSTEWSVKLREAVAATIAGVLYHMGIRNPIISGPVS